MKGRKKGSIGKGEIKRLIEFNKTTKRKYPKEQGLHSRLYRIWRCMKFRCYQKTHPAYKRYSSKNIIVCDEWKNDYLQFREWALNSGYKDNLCLDRIDNDGNYNPSNCRWATRIQNANNSDGNIRLTIFGENKNLIEWSKDKRCSVNYSCLTERIRKGINPEKAISNKQICLNCNKEFKDRIDAKYCSNKCRDRQHALRSKKRRHNII